MTTWQAGEMMIEWSIYCCNFQSCTESVGGDGYEGLFPDPTEHGWQKINGLWHCPKCAAECQIEPGSYKKARGILAPTVEPAEESIRRIREGQVMTNPNAKAYCPECNGLMTFVEQPFVSWECQACDKKDRENPT